MSKSTWIYITTPLCVIGLWWLIGFAMPVWYYDLPSQEHGIMRIFVDNIDASQDADQEFGAFGERFGAASSLFSALALAGVIIALFLQQHDMKETKESISQQVNALERISYATKETQEKTSESIYITTFFSLLKKHEELQGKIHCKPARTSDEPIRGLRAITSHNDKIAGFEQGAFIGKLTDYMEEATQNCAFMDKSYESFRMINEYIARTSAQDKKTMELLRDILKANMTDHELHFYQYLQNYKTGNQATHEPFTTTKIFDDLP